LPVTFPDVDYAHTAAARANRVVKAYRLAEALEEFGRIPDEAERRALLRAAGVRSASSETWSMAVEIYMERHP
jgi:hypothetical protein